MCGGNVPVVENTTKGAGASFVPILLNLESSVFFFSSIRCDAYCNTRMQQSDAICFDSSHLMTFLR